MNTLYLMRHSLTEANEKRLYGGSTDSPLTEKGVAVAEGRRGVIPECDIYVVFKGFIILTHLHCIDEFHKCCEVLFLLSGRLR